MYIVMASSHSKAGKLASAHKVMEDINTSDRRAIISRRTGSRMVGKALGKEG